MPVTAAPADGRLSYGEWLAAKRQFRASHEEREALENRVRRLREEQRSMEATITNAKERVSMIDDARALCRSRKTEREKRGEQLAAEKAARHQQTQAMRIQMQRSIQTARTASAVGRQRARDRVRREEDNLQRSSSARKSTEAAQLSRRREKIQQMQLEARDDRRAYLENRRRNLQEANARDGARVASERDHNVKQSADLLLVEADLLRNLVELRREAKRQTGVLAERITGERQPRHVDDDDDEHHDADDDGADADHHHAAKKQKEDSAAPHHDDEDEGDAS